MNSTAIATVPVQVEKVWAVLSDHEGMTGWAPGLTVRLTKEGSTDRNGIGAVRRISTPLPLPAIVEEVTAFEPGRRLAYRALSGVPLKNYSGEVALKSAGEGTTITYTVAADRRVPVVDAVLTRVIARALLGSVVRASKKAR